MSLALGKPDPSILKPPGGTDFHQFKFKSIGKEPELLKRISNREEGVRYQYSPSPEPESRHQYSPSLEPQSRPPRNGVEARTRPSLLQALTNHTVETQELPFQTPMSAVESPGIDDESMQLQYPEEDVPETAATTKPISAPPSPPPLPPFIPNYGALKELHTRLEASHKVLAVPPPPKKALTPPPDHLRLATNNVIHHTEASYTSTKEALAASQARAAISEQGVTAAQTVVDTLTQALATARAALGAAQKTLSEARKSAEEAQSAFLASRAAADAAEETKKLLAEPPRAPSPEPINDNAETIGELKKELDTLKLWVEEQEAGHLSAVVAPRDASRDREEEEERKASNMVIAPDENDTDCEVPDASTELPAVENPTVDGVKSEVDMDIDEPRRSEEDAAHALVALAEQKITTQDEVRRGRPTLLAQDSKEKCKEEPATAKAEPTDELLVNEATLAREAALRKQQDARREQVRIQKEQAHAAAALSILKERQDAATKSKNPAAQSSPPSSNVDTVLPPAEVKVKVKKSKPVSGGVKLGPEITTKVDPSVSTEPSPALERAAALGLRVRPNSTKSGDGQAAQSSKPKKTRNCSLPPTSQLDSESPQPDEISAYRIGSDPGDIPIIEPTKAPQMPAHLSTDVQLMNLRFALQDEGITWEAISRSRPQLPGVKTEEREDVLRTPGISSSAPQSKTAPIPPQRPLPANPPITTPTPTAPTVTAPPIVAPKPLPSRKQLPKFNKSTAQTGGTNNGQTLKTAAAATAAQPQVISRSKDVATAPARPPEAPPANPRKHSPPPAVSAYPPDFASVDNTASGTKRTQVQARVRTDSRSSNPGSGVSTPVQDMNVSSSYRSFNERVPISDPWRGRSPPPRYGAPARTPDYGALSRTPDGDRYGGQVSNAYGARELERYSGRTPEPFGRSPSPPAFRRNWSPRRPVSPPRRIPSPPPSPPRRAEFSAKRGFSGDLYSPPAPRRPTEPAAFYNAPRHDSPPKGPRHGIPRAPSQKRPREDDYTPPLYPQKRFKDDGRDARAAASWSPESDNDRLSLEHRLGAAPDPNVHLIGRGESYRPATEISNHDREWAPKPDGLLSRLSDPGRGIPRGRGGLRGRGYKTRGRGRGELSLADRMG
ncbi:hypothetical protein B0H19DRAFT_1179086 [Mycena capillaripes]|nr:hypothetical protein B0H19DRAFT_1179086 [Mycena capillaripes]